MATATPSLDYSRLDEIVQLIKAEISKPDIRVLNNRAVQAKVFQIPKVSNYMAELRRAEEALRQDIMKKISQLIHKFQEYSIDVTLARAGILSDSRVHAGSSLEQHDDGQQLDFDLLCLDGKERLYMVLNQYDWLKDFYRFYPQHFYENSFQFVDRIPQKKLHVKVKVVGLGIAGSLAVSGLKKNGVDTVVGYDRRARNGPRSVTSRFQNASWRAYDIAEKMLDDESFQHLVQYQQRINVTYDDGTSAVLSSDRVQIILGDAVDSALESAERYGAKLFFDCDTFGFLKNGGGEDKDAEEDVDIVGLFAGAHTSSLVPGLKEEMNMHSWKDLSSPCILWLEVKESEKKGAYTARDIENGAEKWHFTIEAARNSKRDLVRIRDNLVAQHLWNLRKYKEYGHSANEMEEEEKQHKLTMAKIERLLNELEEKKDDGLEESRYDYIFSNAPDNEHNRAKLDAAKTKGNVVLEGKYTVDIAIASKSMIDASSSEAAKNVLDQFGTAVLVTGGDACVNPNPMAAYGATLACEFAAMLVQLSVAHGHINAIIKGLEKAENVDNDLVPRLKELKSLLNQYYDTRGNAENYFQWMQTLICNLYSLPAQVDVTKL
jgi:Dehydrogenases (flavoproteins)